MRKAQRQKAEDFVKLLEQAHDEIRKALEKQNIVAATSLLADCQDGVIALGKLIEEEEGEGAPTVLILEEYCELVYEIYRNLESEKKVHETDKISKSLRQVCIRIENSIKYDIKVRMEAVFLPYKASMWDSLESVWKAANDDPECDTYVIPIPYYDKNPDGSFKEMHYEGGEYPEYVPVVWYEDYDFNKRKPDMIFIHNPYDNCNYVTSVHPFFYSQNLKRFTEHLIYIPYFVLGEIDPDDRQEVKKMAHFCTVPGAIYADKVIVQSEKMRKIYINVLRNFMSEKTYSETYWNEKIVGLGSPKIDKIQDTKKEDIQIPDKWMSIIQKSDGKRKKIIFYNTSVAALLANRQKMLDKIKKVLHLFYDNKDDVTLLWRPHPLTEATIKSMAPELWEEYREIIEQYKKGNWGIYDDTADVDRAVVLSDGYYGDESSVVQLYEGSKKPIMIQNVAGIVQEHYKRVRFIDFWDDGDNIWFCALFTKGLFRFHKASQKTELICILPTETLHETYRALYLKNGKLYLAPIYAENIVIFDIEEKTLTQITLQVDSDRYRRMPLENMANFMNIYEFKNYLFFVPLSYGAIIRLNTETNSVEYYNDFIELLLPIVHNKEAFWFIQSCIVDDKIYMSSGCANALVEFDMRMCTSIVYRLGKENISYTGICYDRNDFWILGSNGSPLTVWNKEDGIKIKIQLDERGKHNYILPSEKGILRVPCKGELTCDLVERLNYNVSPVKLKVKKNETADIRRFFGENSGALCVKIQEEKIFVYSTERDSLCAFDETGKCLQEYVFEVCKESYRPYIQMQHNRLHNWVSKGEGGRVLFEDYFDSNLSYYLACLSETDTVFGNGRISESFGCGIFKYVKEGVLNG